MSSREYRTVVKSSRVESSELSTAERAGKELDYDKNGHAAKSAQERRHTNHNIHAHLGKYITAATAKSSSFPNKNI
jgi:hypothetical protein